LRSQKEFLSTGDKNYTFIQIKKPQNVIKGKESNCDYSINFESFA